MDARSAALAKSGAEVVVGDLLEINTIRTAMEGVDAVYLCWPVTPDLIHATVNFAQAAKETGVSAIINLSQRSANRESTSDSCRDSFIAEEVLNWSGLPVIHLRPTYFLEWLLYPWQLPYLQQGVLRMPVGKGRHSPIAAELCSEMRFLDRELLRVVLLNAKQHLIKVVTVSQGTVNESLAHPREIFKPVITHSAYSFVMVHNHPSGDATPSEADIRLTRRINEASRILDLKLMDHVIIGTPAPSRAPYALSRPASSIGATVVALAGKRF
jgi:hypothetical protein